jgi:enoyl-CoA hydratase/carnithine racemase
METVLTSVDGAVATVTLNRGAQRNCLHPSVIEGLRSALTSLAEREDVNAVVLTGHGPAFCAGLDLAYLGTLDSEARVTYMRTAFSLFEQLYAMPQPTIAAINGPAVAGGFDLAVFCDLRLCAPGARFAQPEVILGATQFIFPLYTIVGLGRAKELAFTGEAITAEEAWRIGLVNHLVEADELLPRSMALARTIASRPRPALLAAKRVSREILGRDHQAAFAQMGAALDRSLQSVEHRQALEVYLQRLREASRSS